MLIRFVIECWLTIMQLLWWDSYEYSKECTLPSDLQILEISEEY